MKKYEVYSDEKGRSYVAVSKEFSRKKAITVANQHFRTRKNALKVQNAVETKNGLLVGGKTGTVWAVSKR